MGVRSQVKEEMEMGSRLQTNEATGERRGSVEKLTLFVWVMKKFNKRLMCKCVNLSRFWLLVTSACLLLSCQSSFLL